MNAVGTLDRVGTLSINSPSAGVGGAPVDTFVVVAQDLWFKNVSVSTRDVITGARDAGDTERVFICRWFPGLDQGGYYFETEGKRYRITRADELGRREGWQFYGKAIT